MFVCVCVFVLFPYLSPVGEIWFTLLVVLRTLCIKNSIVILGGEKVEVIIKNGDGIPINVDVRDMNDGTYKVVYKVITKEKHSIAVFVRDKLIQDGVYELNVTAGIDCLKIGPLLTKFGSGGVINPKEDDDNYEPWGIVCDNKGNILVSDHNNHKIQVSLYI